ncbi:MAG: phage portal protein [Shinella sp.]|nr:phage portal protein [Shinella sp.]
MAQREKQMDVAQLCTIVESLVKDAETYRTERSDDRVKAMEYFDGEMRDVPADEGRSKVVSRDVRSAIKKVLPSLNRTILGGDKLVEYQPVGQGDEAGAEQATDYVNYVALPECNGYDAIEDAIYDAIKLRNGILKWWQAKSIDVKVSLHTGLEEAAFVQLVSDDNVEVLAHTERQETVDTPQGPMPTVVHDVKIKRRIETSRSKIGAVPPENWLVHPDAVTLEDSPILGENMRLRRSDLVKMGYDRATVDALPASEGNSTEQQDEEDTRRRDVFQREDPQSKALEEIEYYELLVRVDYDDDGIAELRRMVFAGGLKEANLLENTDWDEINYADIVAERRPHQWEGNSVPDDVMDIQKIKTVLLRQTMDNLYWQNNLQPIVQEGAVTNPEAVLNPSFGQPIMVNRNTDVRAAVGYSSVPMVADKSFAMLSYMDNEVTDRTGISDASSGLAPDALQNMTAKASAMIEQAGIGQVEMMVRCIANSLKPVFRGLLKLVIQHQDKPRTVRLRDEWITFDPRAWNADMDATVNTGLGAGTRERDMMAMQTVIGLQRELLASLGPQNPFVKPDNVYNAISKLVEAAGLRNVGLYFTKPDPQEVQSLMQGQQQGPSPEEIKAQAAVQLEQARTQGKLQVEQAKAQMRLAEVNAKMQADANKEREQMEADLAIQAAELEREAAMDERRIEADVEKALIDQETEREWMETQERISDRRLVADVQKAQAASVSRSLDRMPDGNRTGRNGR